MVRKGESLEKYLKEDLDLSDQDVENILAYLDPKYGNESYSRDLETEMFYKKLKGKSKVKKSEKVDLEAP